MGAAPGRDRPTLESVASRAGVSRATASRVVNGSPTVAPRIRDAVLRAVADLGYVPNQAARSLVTQRTDSMALVLSEAASRVFFDDPYFVGIIRGVLVTDDPERDWPPIREAERYRMRVYGRFFEEAGQGGKQVFLTEGRISQNVVVAERAASDADLDFAGIIRGVSHELEAADRQLVLMMAAAGPGHDRVQRYAAAGHVDGVMVASIHGADPLPAALSRIGVPVVCNGRPIGPASVPYVDVANEEGARLAVRHLVERGRRRIATIAGPQDMIAGIDRLTGYRTELRDSDRRSIVAVGDFTRESGSAAMRQLLADDPHLDAVFVASDLMADGALRALRQSGRRVPDDVAVVGFDDADIARYTEPALTTVRQPVLDIGRTMARQLLRLAADESIEPAVILPTELVVRDSA